MQQPEIARVQRKQQRYQNVAKNLNLNEDDDALDKCEVDNQYKNLEYQINEFGYKMEPFNMNADREKGTINEDGFYVFNKKQNDEDAWLNSLGQDFNNGENLLKKKLQNEQDSDSEEEEQEDYQDSSQSENEEKFNEKVLNYQKTKNKQKIIKKPQQEEEIVEKIDKVQLLRQLFSFLENANNTIKKIKANSQQKINQNKKNVRKQVKLEENTKKEIDVKQLKKMDDIIRISNQLLLQFPNIYTVKRNDLLDLID